MPRKKTGSTLGADPLAPYLGESQEAPAQPTPARRTRAITGRIPEELWQRLDVFYQRQPRSVTKDALIARALEVFLDREEIPAGG